MYLGIIGEKLAPVMLAIFYFTLALASVITLLSAFIINFLLKKHYSKIKPVFRILISICLGFLIACVTIYILY